MPMFAKDRPIGDFPAGFVYTSEEMLKHFHLMLREPKTLAKEFPIPPLWSAQNTDMNQEKKCRMEQRRWAAFKAACKRQEGNRFKQMFEESYISTRCKWRMSPRDGFGCELIATIWRLDGPKHLHAILKKSVDKL